MTSWKIMMKKLKRPDLELFRQRKVHEIPQQMLFFYDAEDSGLTFTKKRYKRIYDLAKKRYTKFNDKII